MGGLGYLIIIGVLSPFAAIGALWLAGKIPERKRQPVPPARESSPEAQRVDHERTPTP